MRFALDSVCLSTSVEFRKRFSFQSRSVSTSNKSGGAILVLKFFSMLLTASEQIRALLMTNQTSQSSTFLNFLTNKRAQRGNF